MFRMDMACYSEIVLGPLQKIYVALPAILTVERPAFGSLQLLTSTGASASFSCTGERRFFLGTGDMTKARLGIVRVVPHPAARMFA